ncbi:MAG: IMP dehydrogenase [Endomicrobium sp.]|jgi:IMP dehydrogenase|nr:IMP dehydrogenase [Endomicrobium sp.]
MSKFLGNSLTFDDVLLVPRYSDVLPKDVDLTTNLTRTIKLKIPIISAGMDTVTEADLAIAIARAGGLGVIHKNMSIDLQAKEVDKVKKAGGHIIYNPITLKQDTYVSKVKKLFKKYQISCMPIVNCNNKLLGIVTIRDIRFEDNNTKVYTIMTKKHLITTELGTSLKKAKEILKQNKIEKLPIVDDEFKLQGLITAKDIENNLHFPNASKDKMGNLLVGAAIGITNDMFERIKKLIKAKVDVLVIDTAHGHSLKVINAIKQIKEKLPTIQLIAGNIATATAAKDLIKAGVDAIKVGIGPGAICTTRIITGVGIPQIKAIHDCAKIALNYNIPLIADGGIKYSGDIAKALAAGASTCMIGLLLAGTDESPSKEIIYNNKICKVYRGMGSHSAMIAGSSDRYFQDTIIDNYQNTKLVAEGVEGCIPYQGKVSDVIYQLIGGIKASMGYCGVKTIKDLQLYSQFIGVTAAGITENHPHNIFITKDELNYSK